MIPRHWTVFAFRMLGMWLVISWLVGLTSVVTSIYGSILADSHDQSYWWTLWIVVGLSFPLVIGLLLLRRTDWFVDQIYGRMYGDEDDYISSEEVVDVNAEDRKDEIQEDAIQDEREHLEPQIQDYSTDEPEEVTPSPSARDIQAIMLSVLGVWILSQAIPAAINWVAAAMNARREGVESMLDGMIRHVSIVPILIIIGQLVIGFWLFYRSYAIVDYWRRIGVPKETII